MSRVSISPWGWGISFRFGAVGTLLTEIEQSRGNLEVQLRRVSLACSSFELLRIVSASEDGAMTRASGPKLRIQLRKPSVADVEREADRSRLLANLLRRMPRSFADVHGRFGEELNLDVFGRPV